MGDSTGQTATKENTINTVTPDETRKYYPKAQFLVDPIAVP